VAAQFNEFLKASGDEPVLVTRNGKPIALLLAIQDKAEAERFASEKPRQLRSILEEAHKQIQKSGGIPHDQFWREVRQSRRAKRRASSGAKNA
jgi:prevent-host-death family protein